MRTQLKKVRPAIVAVALTMFFILSIDAFSETVGAEERSVRGPLDGMVFVGKIGPRENPDREDELHFNDGQFWSAICVKCGFEPGEYWVRYEEDSVHFRGELTGERGTFTYYGTISNGKADVSIDWRMERWYWTIEREMVFRGELAGSTMATHAQDAYRIATEVGDASPPGCL